MGPNQSLLSALFLMVSANWDLAGVDAYISSFTIWPLCPSSSYPPPKCLQTNFSHFTEKYTCIHLEHHKAAPLNWGDIPWKMPLLA